MHVTTHTLLGGAACVSFAFAMLGVGSKVNWTALGLLLWCAATFFAR